MDASPATPGQRDWWARPRVVLPVVGAIALLVALLTPEPTVGRIGDSRLSSHLTGSLGAGALARMATRFGFEVVSRDSTAVPDSSTAPGHTIHAVLAPPIGVTPREAHEYLERVRRGDALLFVLGERDALADSLHVMPTSGGGVLRVPPADTAGCRPSRTFIPSLWPDGKVHLYGLLWTHGDPAGVATALEAALQDLQDAAGDVRAPERRPAGRVHALGGARRRHHAG